MTPLLLSLEKTIKHYHTGSATAKPSFIECHQFYFIRIGKLNVFHINCIVIKKGADRSVSRRFPRSNLLLPFDVVSAHIKVKCYKVYVSINSLSFFLRPCSPLSYIFGSFLYSSDVIPREEYEK